MAGLVCLKPGAPGRLFYRIGTHRRRRRGERRSMSEADYGELITAAHRTRPAHRELDNLTTHISTVMRQSTGTHPDWLTLVQLPAYAPQLNATEGVSASMKTGLGDLAACTIDQLAATVCSRLRRIQHRPGLISGFLGQTGLALELQPP